AADRAHLPGMVFIPGGVFAMGSEDGMAGEGPVHVVRVNGFWMDEHELTVEEFGRFARATGYRTQAERDGWSGAFNFKTHGWERVEGANWRAPEGAGSSAPSKIGRASCRERVESAAV